MCLYIGLESRFIAEHDIIVYKKLSKNSEGRWITPFRKWPIEFNKVLLPEGVAREKEYFYSFKHVIEEGAIHAYTFSPDSKKDCEEFFIAKIPAGTIFWLQDDLREVASEKMIITTEHPESRERTDLSNYYKFGVDVYLKDGSRAKNDKSFNVSEVIGLFAFDNRVISTKVKKEVISNDILVYQGNKYSYIDNLEEAKKDMDGYTNTKFLEKYLIDHSAIYTSCKKLGEDWYIPALGELKEAFSNLLYINLTLRKLNLPIINYEWFLSSTMRDKEDIWGCYSYGSYGFCSYPLVSYGIRYILPFLVHKRLFL